MAEQQDRLGFVVIAIPWIVLLLGTGHAKDEDAHA
jgi:hypothetical protein